MNRLLATAFDTWFEQIEDKKRVMSKMKKIAGRMLNALTGMCFDAWVACIEEQRRILRRAAHAIGPGRILWLCYQTWVAAYREVCVQREMERLDSRMEDAIAARMQAAMADLEEKMAKVANMPNELEERLRKAEELKLAEEEKAREARLQRVVRRWQNKTVAVCFDAWAQIVAEGKAALRRAAAAWRNVGMARSWRAWAEVTQERVRLLALAKRVVGRMKHQLLCMTFLPWHELVHTQKRAREAELEAERLEIEQAAERERIEMERERAELDRKAAAMEKDRQKRAKAEQEAAFMEKINSLGASWFETYWSKMVREAELRERDGPKGLIAQIAGAERRPPDQIQALIGDKEKEGSPQMHEKKNGSDETLAHAEETRRQLAGEMSSLREKFMTPSQREQKRAALQAVDDQIGKLRSRNQHKTVLDLLDSRYMSPGGRLHGMHVEAELRQTRDHFLDEFAALREQYASLRKMVMQAMNARESQALELSRSRTPSPRFPELEALPTLGEAQRMLNTSKSSAAVLSRDLWPAPPRASGMEMWSITEVTTRR